MSEGGREEQRKREKETRTSALSAEPHAGLDLRTLESDLSWIQESDAQPTAPLWLSVFYKPASAMCPLVNIPVFRVKDFGNTVLFHNQDSVFLAKD